MLPWVQNNERHPAPCWAFSIMTSYVNLWRHMTTFDVIWRHDDVIMENAQPSARWRSSFCTQGSIHNQNPWGKWLHYGLLGSSCLGFPWTMCGRSRKVDCSLSMPGIPGSIPYESQNMKSSLQSFNCLTNKVNSFLRTSAAHQHTCQGCHTSYQHQCTIHFCSRQKIETSLA